jgi:hypothetical protein
VAGGLAGSMPGRAFRCRRDRRWTRSNQKIGYRHGGRPASVFFAFFRSS